MSTIKIDDVEYDTNNLSEEAKAQLVSLQYCDQELTRLQAKMAAWAAAGFKDTLLRCQMKREVANGDEKKIQPGVQA